MGIGAILARIERIAYFYVVAVFMCVSCYLWSCGYRSSFSLSIGGWPFWPDAKSIDLIDHHLARTPTPTSQHYATFGVPRNVPHKMVGVFIIQFFVFYTSCPQFCPQFCPNFPARGETISCLLAAGFSLQLRCLPISLEATRTKEGPSSLQPYCVQLHFHLLPQSFLLDLMYIFLSCQSPSTDIAPSSDIMVDKKNQIRENSFGTQNEWMPGPPMDILNLFDEVEFTDLPLSRSNGQIHLSIFQKELKSTTSMFHGTQYPLLESVMVTIF
jgi:hypothetical protein